MIKMKSIEELKELSKKDYYCPIQKFYHYNLLYITRLLLPTKITPNQITITWVTIQILASLLMMTGKYSYMIIGVVIFNFIVYLDYIDGQLARIKKQYSHIGLFLEDLGLYFGSPIFFLCFSIGLSIKNNNFIYLIFGIISTITFLYSKLIIINPLLKKSLSMRNKNSKYSFIFLLFRRGQPFNFLLVGIIFNFMEITLIVYSLLYTLELFRKLFMQLKILHRWDKYGIK